MRGWISLLFVAGWLAGCAGAPEEDVGGQTPDVTAQTPDVPTPTPEAPGEPDVLGLDVQHSTDGDEWEVRIKGDMPAGSGWFMFWPFDGLQGGYGASRSVDLEPCAGEVEGAWGLWVPPQPVEWFGTFSSTEGRLDIDVKSPWPQECLVVVETELVVPEFGHGTGYIDQWVERVLPPGTWMQTWG